MAITAMVDSGIVRHVVSQNCDGLHLRSGLKSEKLSEIHGNMFVEMCLNCEPPTTFVRHFDTTQGTAYRRHKVLGAEHRPCDNCGDHNYLYDSVVHCGEYARYEQSPPYRWPEAGESAKEADLVVCIGTSLAVLKSYASLWAGLKRRKEPARLVIINIQPTVKDKQAHLVINQNCEQVFRNVCNILKIHVKDYDQHQDPIYLSRESFISLEPPLPDRCLSSSPTASMPGWMRATVEQMKRAKLKSQRSRRVGTFGTKRKTGATSSKHLSTKN